MTALGTLIEYRLSGPFQHMTEGTLTYIKAVPPT